MKKGAVTDGAEIGDVASSKVTRTFSLDMDVMQRLTEVAQKRGITISRLVNEILKSIKIETYSRKIL